MEGFVLNPLVYSVVGWSNIELAMSQELLKIVHGFECAFNSLLIFIDCDYIHVQLSICKMIL